MPAPQPQDTMQCADPMEGVDLRLPTHRRADPSNMSTNRGGARTGFRVRSQRIQTFRRNTRARERQADFLATQIRDDGPNNSRRRRRAQAEGPPKFSS
jgi:hypothetical protein